MAFERLEPFGWPLLRVVIDWGRAIASLIISAVAGKHIDESMIPHVQAAIGSDPPEDCDEPLDETDCADGTEQPTSVDVLRAVAEQNAFRF